MEKIFKGSIKVIETNVYIWHRCSEENAKGVPIIVVPPHAGRDWTIAWNLIKKALKTGRPVYAFELKPATWLTANTSVDDLILAIKAINDYLGVNIQLFGLCQGGWLSAIYTALFPKRVVRLSLFATPIHTKSAPDNVIERYMRIPYIVEYHKCLVAMQGGIQSGWLQWIAFSMVAPDQIYVIRYLKKYKMMKEKDIEGLEKWEDNNGWYDHSVNIAGWFTQALQHLFRDNELYEGTWEILGRLVDLGDIECEVDLYAGEDDNITHASQMFGMAYKLNCLFNLILFPGAGHTKVFVGKKELNIMAGISLRG